MITIVLVSDDYKAPQADDISKSAAGSSCEQQAPCCDPDTIVLSCHFSGFKLQFKGRPRQQQWCTSAAQQWQQAGGVPRVCAGESA